MTCSRCCFTIDTQFEQLEARTLMAVAPGDAPPPEYTPPAGQAIFVVQHADIDNDGDQDILLGLGGSERTRKGASLVLLVNRGDGTFRRPQVVQLPGLTGQARNVRAYALQLVDFDGDADLDVVMFGRRLSFGQGAGYREEQPRTWTLANDGAGRFSLLLASPEQTAGSFFEPVRLQPIDADGDGDAELLADDLSVWNVTASGRVENLGRLAGTAPGARLVERIDIDRDGDDDFVIRNDEMRAVSVLIDTGATFVERVIVTLAPSASIVECTVRDIDGDSFEDIVVSFTFPRAGGDDGSVVLVGFRNNFGTPDPAGFGPQQTLYSEEFNQIRARGGHPPITPNITPAEIESYSVSLSRVEDLTADGRLDLVVTLVSQQGYTIRDRLQHPQVILDWNERYTLALVAQPMPMDAIGILPEYIPDGSIPVPGEPDIPATPPSLVPKARSLTGIVVSDADFDGDGLADRVFTLGGVPGPNSSAKSLYIDFARRGTPIAWDIKGGERGENFDRSFGPGSTTRLTLRVNFGFDAPAAEQAVVREAAMFLDSNGNGRLDAGDRRLAALSTPTSGNRWRFDAIREDSWGRGFFQVFLIAANAQGVLGVPIGVTIRLQ